MGEVINLDIPTKGDLPPNLVLDGALEADLKEVFVCGLTQDGGLYLASSGGYLPDMLFLLELAKRSVMEQAV